MGWDLAFFSLYAGTATATVVVALVRGVVWGMWGFPSFDVFTVRRRANPVGFWLMTSLWFLMSLLALAGTIEILARSS
jgi:hypothetical protein